MIRELYHDDQGNALRHSLTTHFEGYGSFKELSLKAVLTGQETYYVHGKKFVVNAGECLIGKSISNVEIKIRTNEPTEGICIDFKPEFLSSKLKEKLNEIDFPLIKCHLNSIQKNVLQHQITQPYFNPAYTFEKLVEVSSIFEEKIQTAHQAWEGINAITDKTKKDLIERLHLAKTCIDNNPFIEIHLDKIAEEASLSKFHFIKLFKSSFGSTPYQYLLCQRLVHAQKLLLSGAPINEVALQTGFADSASFCKIFKKKIGTTPLNFRLLSKSQYSTTVF